MTVQSCIKWIPILNKNIITSWFSSKMSFSTILQFALFTDSIAVSSVSLSPLLSTFFEIIALIFFPAIFFYESTIVYNQDKTVTKYWCNQFLSIYFNLLLLPDVRILWFWDSSRVPKTEVSDCLLIWLI